MTTVVADSKSAITAYQTLCNANLTKPITKAKLLLEHSELRLIK
jgi:hypothetical protein